MRRLPLGPLVHRSKPPAGGSSLDNGPCHLGPWRGTHEPRHIRSSFAPRSPPRVEAARAAPTWPPAQHPPGPPAQHPPGPLPSTHLAVARRPLQARHLEALLGHVQRVRAQLGQHTGGQSAQKVLQRGGRLVGAGGVQPRLLRRVGLGNLGACARECACVGGRCVCVLEVGYWLGGGGLGGCCAEGRGHAGAHEPAVASIRVITNTGGKGGAGGAGGCPGARGRPTCRPGPPKGLQRPLAATA